MAGTIEQGAEVAVNKCMKVNPDDRVLIVADDPTKDLGMAIRAESLKITEKVRFFNLDLPAYGGRPIKSMPESLIEAIKQATVTFFTAGPRENELQTLREPFLKLVAQTARHAHMVGITNIIMETGMCADYDEIKKVTDRVYEIVRIAKEIHVTSPAGTDFLVELDPDIKWIPCSGVVEKRGEWDNLPSGEVFTAPKSLVGRLVVDGTVGDWIGTKYNGKFDYKEMPLDIEVEHQYGGSYIKSVKCDYTELLDDFNEYVAGDVNAARVGELGIGTNLFLEEIIGNILQDEKFPTVHVAFGDPYHEKTGANWTCNHHIDLLMRKCSIVVDGVKIMDEGVYTDEIIG